MFKLKNIILNTTALLALSTQVHPSAPSYYGISVDSTSTNAAKISSLPSNANAVLVKSGNGELELPTSAPTSAKAIIAAGTLGIQNSMASVGFTGNATLKHVGTGTNAAPLSATITTLDTAQGAATISLPNNYTNLTATTLSGTGNVTLTALGTGNTFTITNALPAGSESFTINSGTLKFPAAPQTLVATGGITIAAGGTADCTLGGVPVGGAITMNGGSSATGSIPMLTVKAGTNITNAITVN